MSPSSSSLALSTYVQPEAWEIVTKAAEQHQKSQKKQAAEQRQKTQEKKVRVSPSSENNLSHMPKIGCSFSNLKGDAVGGIFQQLLRNTKIGQILGDRNDRISSIILDAHKITNNP